MNAIMQRAECLTGPRQNLRRTFRHHREGIEVITRRIAGVCLAALLSVGLMAPFSTAGTSVVKADSPHDFFLHDDGAFTSTDTTDTLNSTPPGSTLSDPQSPMDFDADGTPGLTISPFSGGSTGALASDVYHEWAAAPLGDDLVLSGSSRIHLYTSSSVAGAAGSAMAFVIDYDPATSEESLIGCTVVADDPWTEGTGWEEKVLHFVPRRTSVDPSTGFPYYFLASGHQLVLRLMVDGSEDASDIIFAYDSVEYPSRLSLASTDADNVQPPTDSDCDWVVSGHDLFSGLPGNVGLGTSEPDAKLHVVGDTIFDGSLGVGGESSFMELTATGLTVNGDSALNGNLGVTGDSTLGGGLDVAGASSMQDSLKVAGSTDTDTLTVNGQSHLMDWVGIGTNDPKNHLHLKASRPGGHIAHFENTAGGDADGIGITIHNEHTNSENNFVTFYSYDDDSKSSTTTGRIEGFDYETDFDTQMALLVTKTGDSTWNSGGYGISGSDWEIGQIMDWKSMVFTGKDNFTIPELTVTVGFPGIASKTFHIWDGITIPVPNGIKVPPDIDWNLDYSDLAAAMPTYRGQYEPLLEWAIETDNTDLIATSPFDIAVAAYLFKEKPKLNDEGVTYGSQGKDYAEWLPKEDPDELMMSGFIVGIHGGKASKNTEGADQVLAVSTSPVVLGNMRPEGDEDGYVPVGFMGQLPVAVWGHVDVGDYIVPSGINDGAGIAISPDEIELEDLPQVLGRAWSASEDDSGLNMINVSIGLKSNEWVEILEQHSEKLETLETELEELKAEIADIKALLE